MEKGIAYFVVQCLVAFRIILLEFLPQGLQLLSLGIKDSMEVNLRRLEGNGRGVGFEGNWRGVLGDLVK